jgi:hypothetical protein
MCQRRIRNISKRDVPFGRLAASFVRLRLFGFLTQPGSAVRVLFSHGPLVGQISGAVHDDNQGAYYRPVDRHVGEDACCMSSAKVGEIHRLGRHAAAMARVRDLGREGASSESGRWAWMAASAASLAAIRRIRCNCKTGGRR